MMRRDDIDTCSPTSHLHICEDDESKITYFFITLSDSKSSFLTFWLINLHTAITESDGKFRLLAFSYPLNKVKVILTKLLNTNKNT